MLKLKPRVQCGDLNLHSPPSLNKGNEAQKPVEIIEYLIRLTTREQHTVLDPFMGSRTTAIATINTKRNFIGFEKNKDYWRITEERIKNHKEQLKLF